MASKLQMLLQKSSHGRLLQNLNILRGGGGGSNIAVSQQTRLRKLPLLARRWKKPSREDFELGFDHGYFVSDDELEFHEYDEDIQEVLRENQRELSMAKNKKKKKTGVISSNAKNKGSSSKKSNDDDDH